MGFDNVRTKKCACRKIDARKIGKAIFSEYFCKRFEQAEYG